MATALAAGSFSVEDHASTAPQAIGQALALHNRRPGGRIEEVGMPHVEDEPDLLAHVELIRGPDAGDEGMGVAGQVEIGFRPQRLDDFDHCLHCAPRRSIGW